MGLIYLTTFIELSMLHNGHLIGKNIMDG